MKIFPVFKNDSVLGISNARYFSQDRTAIDMTVRTDQGDFPFLYRQEDGAPLAKLVKAFLDAKPDFPIAPYLPKPAPKTKTTKGGDND